MRGDLDQLREDLYDDIVEKGYAYREAMENMIFQVTDSLDRWGVLDLQGYMSRPSESITMIETTLIGGK
jgi:hypothetical protein